VIVSLFQLGAGLLSTSFDGYIVPDEIVLVKLVQYQVFVDPRVMCLGGFPSVLSASLSSLSATTVPFFVFAAFFLSLQPSPSLH
jgi:hypothetical protein